MMKMPKLNRFDIHRDDGPLYLRRFYLFPLSRRSDERNWMPFSLKLHAIYESDSDPFLHDHPWWFVSLILKGGYIEEMPNDTYLKRGRFSLAFRRATDLHRLHLGSNRPTWTLVLTGKRKRTWGFAVPAHDGSITHVPWNEYFGVAA